MFILKKAFCRVYQTAFHMALPILPYREPEIIFSCSGLDTVFRKEKIKTVLIVTDEGIVENKLEKPLKNVIKSSGIKYFIYDKTNSNPTVYNVEEAFSIYKENKCDSIIAIGGGSSMDCAKAVGARVAYPEKSLDKLKGTLRVLRKIPTLIAIPTTAGTGSEVTLSAVITDPDIKHKYVMNDFVLIPKYAVLDPTLTYSLPQHLTATTGMDALTHAVEAYIGHSTSKETRQKALEAISLIFKNIENAYTEGDDYEARANMLKASYCAGIAFSKSYVGYIHAIAHSLGGEYNTPHGLANAVIMPYVLNAYGECIYKKLHKLAVAVKISNYNEDYKISAQKFIEAIKNLNKKMGIPDKMEVINRKDINKMARHADKEANPLYPVPKLMNVKELEELYLQISKGENK